MYNARVFYNNITGEMYRCQTITAGGALPIDDDKAITAEMFDVSVDDIGMIEWDNPENELEQLMADGKIIKVDISQPTHTIYGVEPEVVPVVEYATAEDYEAALKELGV